MSSKAALNHLVHFKSHLGHPLFFFFQRYVSVHIVYFRIFLLLLFQLNITATNTTLKGTFVLANAVNTANAHNGNQSEQDPLKVIAFFSQPV